MVHGEAGRRLWPTADCTFSPSRRCRIAKLFIFFRKLGQVESSFSTLSASLVLYLRIVKARAPHLSNPGGRRRRQRGMCEVLFRLARDETSCRAESWET